jgi:hypothetical protein
MKGRLIVGVLVIVLGLAGCGSPESVTAPIPKTDGVFYIENPALKLSDKAGHITDITDPHDDYAIILGYSEYPLVIRKDRGEHPYITLNSEGTEFIVHTELDDKEVFYYSWGGEIRKGKATFSDEENNTDTNNKTYYTEDGKEAYAKYPENSEETDDLNEYYYTWDYRHTGIINIYRFDGTLKPVFEKDVKNFKTFSGTEDFIYSDDEHLYLYDASNDESVQLADLGEESEQFLFSALPDLSEIYYSEWLYEWVWHTRPYPLYAIKWGGEKEIVDERVIDYIVKGGTLYYLTGNSEVYIRKNGKNELLSKITHDYGYIYEGDIEIDESGYFIVNLHSAFEIVDNYAATDSYKSNFFLSTDGKNFVGIEEYVK